MGGWAVRSRVVLCAAFLGDDRWVMTSMCLLETISGGSFFFNAGLFVHVERGVVALRYVTQGSKGDRDRPVFRLCFRIS